MTIYRDAISAVVRCLAAECIDNTAKQAWQRQYQSGWPELRGGSGIGQRDMMDYDCMVHACLHERLSSHHWLALVAKFSTHTPRKVEAIEFLARRVASPSPAAFRDKCVTAWAFPPMKGKDGKRSVGVVVLPPAWYDMSNWDTEARPERTRHRWKTAIRRSLEDLVNVALVEAQAVLEEHGLLIDRAA